MKLVELQVLLIYFMVFSSHIYLYTYIYIYVYIYIYIYVYIYIYMCIYIYINMVTVMHPCFPLQTAAPATRGEASLVACTPPRLPCRVARHAASGATSPPYSDDPVDID